MKKCENRSNVINRNDNMMIWMIWTGNNIGESGAKMISESLKINTTLTELNLGVMKLKWMKKKKKTKNVKANMKWN